MLTALLITMLPTLLAYILLEKIGLNPKSIFLKIALSWFTGLFFFTIASFFLAAFYSLFTTNILLKATYTILLGTQVALLFLVRDVHRFTQGVKQKIKPFTKKRFTTILLIGFCFSFSYAFFAHHLTIQDGTLYTTPIYWDFHWHAALVNNFAYGDNIPPENEAFAGLPHTYHYMWGVVAAIYVVAGLNLADAINTVSILAFGMILLALIGLGEELFKSRAAGFLAVLLAITSGSLHFIIYFAYQQGKSLPEIIETMLGNANHPWYESFLPGNAFGYNGTMLNLFYFLEERQMIFGVVYLLLCVWVLHKRNHFSNRLLVLLGACMGGYFLWHLHITIMILCALIFLLLFDKHKKQTALLLLGFIIIFGVHYLYFKSVMQSEWFYQDITGYPRFNFGFSSGENEPFSWKDFFVYNIFSYGFKIVFLIISLIYLFKKNRSLFLLLCAIIIPTFILTNAIQLSPSSIYENHKWFRPMNIIIDLACAYILWEYFFSKKKFAKLSLGFIFLVIVTLSGIKEHAPFFNSSPTQEYAEYPSSISKAITNYSSPQDTFIGTDTREINLAGRKVFLGNNLGGEMRFKKNERKQIIYDIYTAENLTEFCTITKKYGIDYVEFDNESYPKLKSLAKEFPHFTAANSVGEEVFFVDVRQSCR